MTARSDALARLRGADAVARSGVGAHQALAHGLREAGVGFAAVGGPLEARWDQALRELAECISTFAGDEPTLSEGGVYHGAWVESTGTINSEVLTRFAPAVTRATHLLYATHQREDGLLPYKVTADGPAFSQIQIVTPLARSVWRHYLLAGRDRAYLETMYAAMVRMDAWLADTRDTRGTGGVEAFCTFDTGHDLSPRFWHVPDRAFEGEAGRVDPANPLVPFVAPDLTANVAAQRDHLALISDELGLGDGDQWRARADASREALWEQCWDAQAGAFFDRDARGDLVRVLSDIQLRVLACDVGDNDFAAQMLSQHLMHTGRFLAHYGFTSIAMDDPRFDRDFSRNSWAGPSNYLSALRAPDAFEPHARVTELAIALMPLLAAAATADRFPQCVDPWSGAPGFTEKYSPAILWFLDTIERHFGVMPRPDGSVWLSGLAPTRLDHGAAASAVAYRRTVAGTTYELAADHAAVEVWRDGESWLEFPRGWRVELDAAGDVASASGMVAGKVHGALRVGAASIEATLAGNERMSIDARGAALSGGAPSGPGVITPRS